MTHQFIAPTKVRLRYPDGNVVLVGYGIGDSIDVVESPKRTRRNPMSDAVTDYVRSNEPIVLADGTSIVEFVDGVLNLKPIWGIQ